MARVFESGIPWSRPDEMWIDKRTWLQRKKTNGLFHGAWGFTRDAFLSVGGYPAMQSGQDQALAGRFRKAGILAESPEGSPSYVYRWYTYAGARHLSALGRDGYERRGGEKRKRIQELRPGWSRDWAEKVPMSDLTSRKR